MQGGFRVSLEFKPVGLGELLESGDGGTDLVEACQPIGMPLGECCRVRCHAPEADAAMGQGKTAAALSHQGDGCPSSRSTPLNTS